MSFRLRATFRLPQRTSHRGSMRAWLLIHGLAFASAISAAPAEGPSFDDRSAQVSTRRTLGERRLQEVSKRLNCLCPGCLTQLSNCPHVRCGFSNQARSEIGSMIAAGLADQQIIDGMVERYGVKVLATPPAEGAHLGAYLTPILFVLLGSVGAFLLLRRWQRRGRERLPDTSELRTAVDPRVEAHLASLE